MTNEARDAAVLRIRKALRARSGKTWSVVAGRGESADWIRITAPHTRRHNNMMLADDAAELGALLGLNRPAYIHGEEFQASSPHRVEYIDRAEGRIVGVAFSSTTRSTDR